ncbi:hypothetical protein BIW11_02275 [Tropilaelaps mercedesae]|uniref:Uncharacterized protein n=1 Tax=Tropilaelaps mercedesae TaxID=418985 RepID=A0A1V9X0L2_9ACAR|nr:hypothetical protein BIW11_02275 [Tropilaelaps mercedesae]
MNSFSIVLIVVCGAAFASAGHIGHSLSSYGGRSYGGSASLLGASVPFITAVQASHAAPAFQQVGVAKVARVNYVQQPVVSVKYVQEPVVSYVTRPVKSVSYVPRPVVSYSAHPVLAASNTAVPGSSGFGYGAWKKA